MTGSWLSQVVPYVAARFRDSGTRTEILRQELADAIRQAALDGLLRKDMCEVTGYTRQQVRRFTNAGPGELAAE
ncbi:hypothetical protein [Streptomyces laculatispora]|uniref:hypothetical protein n=1 Tax=Streptomyces laculatispora TaxID=887464 RepID=UPI001A93F001|nr:hypothetical protein [Streptomyces laculatispora]MBO0914073.1 hypothetical protein [Streptomyces laculatispora]